MTTVETSAFSSRLRVLAAAALFSSGGAAIKAASLNAWQVAGFRSAVAAVALVLMMPEALRRPSLRVLLTGVSYAATMVLFVLSNKLTTSASAIFLQSTAPLHVLLLSPWLLGERVRRADLIYMGVLGLGLTSFFVGLDPVSATAPNPWLGNVLATLSGVTWALTVMGLRALGRGGSDWGPASALWGNVIACLVCLPLALPVESSRPVDWFVIAYLGVFQIALAYVFLIRGLRQVPALEASLLLLLEPVLNPIWAWMAHGERPGSWSIAGGLLILLASLAKSAWDARAANAERAGC
ncbi:MAG TPA: EamA family transporter [Thermoanaerobaculia bacterium]|nr:EamA family transporter [Thermoanaerobaculia bacterium]